LTFVPKVPSDDQIRHRELLERLDALARAQQAALARMDALESRR
jgi:hypothetical protein